MPLERARVSAQFVLARVQDQIADLRRQEFPGDQDGPRKWLGLASGFARTAQSYLEESIKNTVDAPSLIQDANVLTHGAYEFIEVMSGSDAEQLPHYVVPPLSRWFQALGRQNTMLFRCEHVANYELDTIIEDDIGGTTIRNLSSFTKNAVDAIRWPFLRVTVPSRALGILPHYAIVAHELGHALIPDVPWQLARYKSAERALSRRVRERLGVRRLSKTTKKELNKARRNWFAEIAADAFALSITGPAFFFALCEFFQLVGSGHGVTSTHPPNGVRRRILHARLSSLNRTPLDTGRSFCSVFARHTERDLTRNFNSPFVLETPPVNDFYSAILINESKHVAAIWAELIPYSEDIAPTIYEEVVKYVLQEGDMGSLYTPQQFDWDLTRHLSALDYAIPPAEFAPASGPRHLYSLRETSLASILNVGWVSLLTRIERLQVRVANPATEMAERTEKLHQLLLKAVELSEARYQWAHAKEAQ